MQSTKTLAKEGVTYRSGKKAYKGAVLSSYAGSLRRTVSVRPQLSWSEDTLVIPDAELIAVGKRLKKGQIGALKGGAEEIQGGTTIMSDIVAEVYDATQAIELSRVDSKTIDDISLTFDYTDRNGDVIPFDEYFDWRLHAIEHNSNVRKQIESLKKANGHKRGGKMSTELLDKIGALSKTLKSVSGFDIVISISSRHEIHTTDNFVECNNEELWEKAKSELNYEERKTRLIGIAPKWERVIPIQTVEQMQTLIAALKEMKVDGIDKVQSTNVCTESFNPDNLDLEDLRIQDAEMSTGDRDKEYIETDFENHQGELGAIRKDAPIVDQDTSSSSMGEGRETLRSKIDKSNLFQKE